MTTGQEDRILDAVEAGDLDTLRAMLRENPRRVEVEDERGWTPLMRAVASIDRRFDVVELLLAQGARADHSASDGWNVLHALSMGSGEECVGEWPARYVASLLEAGADLEGVTAWGWTPLVAAVMEVDLLLARTLLDAGAHPNVQFSRRAFPVFTRGWTLAHFCSSQVDGADFLELLLAAKVDCKRTNDQGETVLALCERTLSKPEDDMDEEYLENVRACMRLLTAR